MIIEHARDMLNREKMFFDKIQAHRGSKWNHIYRMFIFNWTNNIAPCIEFV